MVAARTPTPGLASLISFSPVAMGSETRTPVIRVKGPISTVDAEARQIVVLGLTVQITPGTVITTNGVTIDFEALVVGLSVTVSGAMAVKGSKSTTSQEG
jgi:hypothetical protein